MQYQSATTMGSRCRRLVHAGGIGTKSIAGERVGTAAAAATGALIRTPPAFSVEEFRLAQAHEGRMGSIAVMAKKGAWIKNIDMGDRIGRMAVTGMAAMPPDDDFRTTLERLRTWIDAR